MKNKFLSTFVPILLTVLIIGGTITFVLVVVDGKDWEQLCRDQAELYNVTYIDNIGSSKCWVRQRSGDLIDLWN